MAPGSFSGSLRTSILLFSFGFIIAITAAELLYLLLKQEGKKKKVSKVSTKLKKRPFEEQSQLELDSVVEQNEGILSEETVLLLLRTLTNEEDVLLLEKVLVTIANCAAFTRNQDSIRTCNGLPLIMKFLDYPSETIQIKAAQACSNLAVNTENQDQIQVCIPRLLHNNNSSLGDDLIQAHLQVLINLSVLNTWHSTILGCHLSTLLVLLQSSKKSIQVQVTRLLVNLSCDTVSVSTLLKSEILSVVGEFLSTTCSQDLTIGAVTVIANILQNSTQAILKEDENVTSDSQDSLGNYTEKLGIKHQLVLLQSHQNEDIRFQSRRALQLEWTVSN